MSDLPGVFEYDVPVRYSAQRGGQETTATAKIHGDMTWTQLQNSINDGFKDANITDMFQIKQVTSQARTFKNDDPPSKRTGDVWPWLRRDPALRKARIPPFAVWGFSEQGL
eukprot:TRINITY_DN577_c0_g1_i1.p1 TRINITY_DN577_c0_g1~~TRINITY_DN577_c0_g1_i1.p1  ORF type:complete len:111 (-),score=11.41 TRINITY_DN577_c0_g1_i1:107-439(-)